MKELFAAHGKVEKVNLPTNKNTGQPRGFAFVDMATNAELEAAIAALDGHQFGGRVLRVLKSVPKEQQEKKQEKPLSYPFLILISVYVFCTNHKTKL